MGMFADHLYCVLPRPSQTVFICNKKDRSLSQAPSLESFLKSSDFTDLAQGPIALIVVEDDIGVGACIRHHARLGFKNILLLEATEYDLPADCQALCRRIDCDLPVNQAVNSVIDASPGRWIYYCYNAEFLHFPFCEDRNIQELITFIQEERRAACLSYVVDLYCDDLNVNPLGYSLEAAHLDSSGYYATPRRSNGDFLDRQLNVYGGLKWRFEEHFSEPKRRIDRICLFEAKKGLKMGVDLLLNDPEYNTYECPWHNSTTVAVCSFRTAKYLKSNAGSTFEIESFNWPKTRKFHWNSQQLMDLGLMEPGQWF